jgi:hypothetical protein
MKALKFFSVVALLSAVLIGFSQALPDENIGSISGVVHPTEAMATVDANRDGEVVASTEVDPETGKFKIEGLPAGTYEIVITPGSQGYGHKTVSDVSVKTGENNDLGEIYLEWIKEEWL